MSNVFVSPLTQFVCTRCNVDVKNAMPQFGSVARVICQVCKQTDKITRK